MLDDKAFITGRLNVDDYVNARKGDIEKLESLLDSSGSGAKKRAFQSLPRVERRRAASHNPKRVPRRKGLRKIAELEAIRDNSLNSRKHVRREVTPKHVYQPIDLAPINEMAKFPSGLAGVRYENRQRNKVWLPTHVWHKKRAFMENIANIEVPLTPTQKQYRRTYRLTSHVEERGAIAWDTSYYSTVIARGKDSTIHSIVEKLFPGSTSAIYLNGAKHWQGLFIGTLGVTPTKGPALVHWIDQRSAAIQCNPLFFPKVWDELIHYSNILEVQDCRCAIGNIDILGLGALRILTKILNVKASNNSMGTDSWSNIRSSGILPYRMALQLSVADPRLPNFSGEQTHLSVYTQEDRLASLKFGSPKDVATCTKKVIIPVCLFALDDGRIRITLPHDWVLPFWLRIFENRNSVLIGGIKELHQLAFEKSSPFYPHDFVYTEEGFQCALNKSITGNDHLHTHLPKRSQAKPQPIEDLTKFLSPSEGVRGEYTHVVLTPIVRGVPKSGAKIFTLSESDSADSYGRVDIKSDVHIGRLIGFVTTGNFSLLGAKGSGMGIVKSNMNRGSHCLVLNSDETQGFIAVLTVKESTQVTQVL